MSSPKYHSLQTIMATLDRLGINKTPKPEVITVEGEREKLLPNWKSASPAHPIANATTAISTGKS